MIKTLLIALIILFTCSCNRESKKQSEQITDSVSNNLSADTLVNDSDSARLMDISNKILLCLKNKDLTCLANYVHPLTGVRFSPYAHIDTVTDRLVKKDSLVLLSTGKKKINWGSYDAGEEEIIMDIDTYMDKFVYDVDFLNAKQKTVNSSHAHGNMINNLESVYPGISYTEFYFPGFDPKYDGMDWRALRLVFKKTENNFFLIGIIHDQWTI